MELCEATADTAPQIAAGRVDQRVNVLGVGISVLTLDTAWEAVCAALDAGQQGYVTVTGVHGVSESQSDDELRRIHNRSLLSTPDGMPLVWMGRLQGFKAEAMDRVYGPDLMLEVLARGQARGLRHYFYGGRAGVAESLREKMLCRYPEAQIVGASTPPFRPLTEEEEHRLVEQLNGLRPHCIWIGLSTPKQERLMAGLIERYGRAATQDQPQRPHFEFPLVMFGVGAAFDFHSGQVRQAPRWMQRSGLEWLFRLQQDPRRLWRRYLKNNPLFLGRAALQLSGLRTYPLERE